MKTEPDFASRLLPAPRDGGLELPDHWVWCGSPVRDDAGRYHLFASRIPRALEFHPHWLFCSEIVRAEAEKAAGPYRMMEIALPPRPGFFDGGMTHNPCVRRFGDSYALFYLGSNYDGTAPTPAHPEVFRSPRYLRAWAAKRIGLATASSPLGPWKRLDRPLLEPRACEWDAVATTNPAVAAAPGGGPFVMIYKSRPTPLAPLRLGLAVADHFAGPYRRVGKGPFAREGVELHVEDPCLWWEDGRFHLLMKDMGGELTGERHAAAYVTSADGLNWDFSQVRKGFSRKLRWDDGSETVQGSLERPQVLVEDGVATHLFCATMDGPGGFAGATRVWNAAIPLAPLGAATCTEAERHPLRERAEAPLISGARSRR